MSALKEFNNELKQARALLKRIEQHIDNYPLSIEHQFVHWGHVGDIANIKTQLQEIVNCFSKE